MAKPPIKTYLVKKFFPVALSRQVIKTYWVIKSNHPAEWRNILDNWNQHREELANIPAFCQRDKGAYSLSYLNIYY